MNINSREGIIYFYKKCKELPYLLDEFNYLQLKNNHLLQEIKTSEKKRIKLINTIESLKEEIRITYKEYEESKLEKNVYNSEKIESKDICNVMIRYTKDRNLLPEELNIKNDDINPLDYFYREMDKKYVKIIIIPKDIINDNIIEDIINHNMNKLINEVKIIEDINKYFILYNTDVINKDCKIRTEKVKGKILSTEEINGIKIFKNIFIENFKIRYFDNKIDDKIYKDILALSLDNNNTNEYLVDMIIKEMINISSRKNYDGIENISQDDLIDNGFKGNKNINDLKPKIISKEFKYFYSLIIKLNEIESKRRIKIKSTLKKIVIKFFNIKNLSLYERVIAYSDISYLYCYFKQIEEYGNKENIKIINYLEDIDGIKDVMFDKILIEYINEINYGDGTNIEKDIMEKYNFYLEIIVFMVPEVEEVKFKKKFYEILIDDIIYKFILEDYEMKNRYLFLSVIFRFILRKCGGMNDIKNLSKVRKIVYIIDMNIKELIFKLENKDEDFISGLKKDELYKIVNGLYEESRDKIRLLKLIEES